MAETQTALRSLTTVRTRIIILALVQARSLGLFLQGHRLAAPHTFNYEKKARFTYK